MNRDFEMYMAGLTSSRRERLRKILDCFSAAVPDVERTMRYNMPTLERDGNWVSVASQRHYISVYFCDESLVKPIGMKHPALDVGKGCVRIRDRQELPLKDLERAFKSAMRRTAVTHG